MSSQIGQHVTVVVLMVDLAKRHLKLSMRRANAPRATLDASTPSEDMGSCGVAGDGGLPRYADHSSRGQDEVASAAGARSKPAAKRASTSLDQGCVRGKKRKTDR